MPNRTLSSISELLMAIDQLPAIERLEVIARLEAILTMEEGSREVALGLLALDLAPDAQRTIDLRDGVPAAAARS